MSSSLKSPPEGLKNAKFEKGTALVRQPIWYVPPTDLHEKQETEHIKVKLPDGTKFQMPTYGSGNNKKYLVHVILVLRLVEQKGTAAKVKEAFVALVKVREEMSPFFNLLKTRLRRRKKQEKRSSATLTSPSRPKNLSRLNRPRRLTSCSVVLSLVRRKRNGTGL
jgi:hypothetical protein